MKKFFTVALLAVCAVTAQAITTEWTKITVAAGDTINLTDYFGEDYKGSFSVALVFNQTEAPTAQVANSMFWIGSNSTGANIGAGTGKSTVSNVAHYFVWGSAGNGFASNAKAGEITLGTNVAGLTVTRDSESPATFSVNYYGNEALTGAYNYTGKAATIYDDLHVVTGGTLYIINEVATTSDFAALPEPTVLALLTLGVAGVALKRKVA